MEKGTFIMWLGLTIFQTIIFMKLAKLNKIIEEELNSYVEWKVKHNEDNIIENYIRRNNEYRNREN